MCKYRIILLACNRTLVERFLNASTALMPTYRATKIKRSKKHTALYKQITNNYDEHPKLKYIFSIYGKHERKHELCLLKHNEIIYRNPSKEMFLVYLCLLWIIWMEWELNYLGEMDFPSKLMF